MDMTLSKHTNDSQDNRTEQTEPSRHVMIRDRNVLHQIEHFKLNGELHAWFARTGASA